MRSTTDDFRELETLQLPIRRAAYSDRTAWTMSLLSELAYLPFEEMAESDLLSVVSDLASLSADTDKIERLRTFQKNAASLKSTRGIDDLKSALAAGGFELLGRGILYDVQTDTQGFVARRTDDSMVVIVFRGTQETKDWQTNLKLAATQIDDSQTGATLGSMHTGFHSAFLSVRAQIDECLQGYDHLPLYLTGHSLGGALAVVATWYLQSEHSAACYTFGAPRVGDQNLIHRFKTPIYRVVNGPDPVPFIPPSATYINVLKSIVRIFDAALPGLGIFGWMANKLVQQQNFRHYGYMRYLTVCDPGPAGDFPDLRVEYSLSSFRRLSRFVQLFLEGNDKRIDKYHSITLYRRKLRAHALRHNA